MYYAVEHCLVVWKFVRRHLILKIPKSRSTAFVPILLKVAEHVASLK